MDFVKRLVWDRGSDTRDLDIVSFEHNREPNSAAEAVFTVSNKSGEFNYHFMPGDKISLYYGLGQLPSTPQFIGFPVSVSGTATKRVTCVDFLACAKYEQLKLDENNNYDGYEASAAIATIISGLAGTPLTMGKSGDASRHIIVEDDDIRYPKYADKLTAIQDINDLCWDEDYVSNDYHPLPYFFYVSGTTFFQARQPQVSSATPVLTVTYADNMIAAEPEYTADYTCTKCTYVGSDYEDAYGVQRNYEGTHTDSSTSGLMRTFHAVKENDKLPSDADCVNAAMRYVQANKALTVQSAIKNPDAMYLVPGISVIEVEDSRYGMDGNHLVTGVTVSASPGNFDVTAQLSKRKTVITDFV